MSRPSPFAEPIGWPLLPRPDASGRLRYPSLEQSIREQIRVILSTRPGEQLQRPRFGGGLQSFLHEPDDLNTRRRIRDAVATALAAWEARIDVLSVDVSDVEGHPGCLRVEITYRIRRTGVARTLGLTLETEAA